MKFTAGARWRTEKLKTKVEDRKTEKKKKVEDKKLGKKREGAKIRKEKKPLIKTVPRQQR